MLKCENTSFLFERLWHASLFLRFIIILHSTTSNRMVCPFKRYYIHESAVKRGYSYGLNFTCASTFMHEMRAMKTKIKINFIFVHVHPTRLHSDCCCISSISEFFFIRSTRHDVSRVKLRRCRWMSLIFAGMQM